MRRQKNIRDLTKSEEERISSQSEREIEYSIKQLEVNVLINTLTEVILNTNKINTKLHLAEIIKENNEHISGTSEWIQGLSKKIKGKCYVA